MATDLDAHMTSAGSFTPGSRLESIDDAQQRQLQRSLAKMNELPLRCSPTASAASSLIGLIDSAHSLGARECAERASGASQQPELAAKLCNKLATRFLT